MMKFEGTLVKKVLVVCTVYLRITQPAYMSGPTELFVVYSVVLATTAKKGWARKSINRKFSKIKFKS